MNKPDHFFSIIIPTFNSEELLSLSLSSIANQTFKDVEVLLMDGASNDTTLAVAETYKGQLPHLFLYSENDEGIYDAMNKGINRSKGKWLFFMGSDDVFYDANVLKEVADFLEGTQAKVVYGNAKIIGDTGWAKDGAVYDGMFTLKKLIAKNICHQAIFYNSLFIKDKIGGFNTTYKQCSDWDFNLRCWAQRPFEYMDQIVANFKAGGVSTNTIDTVFFNDYVRNLLSYFRITPFHRLLNNPNFICYEEVIKLQKSKFPITYTIQQLRSKLKKTLKIT